MSSPLRRNRDLVIAAGVFGSAFSAGAVLGLTMLKKTPLANYTLVLSSVAVACWVSLGVLVRYGIRMRRAARDMLQQSTRGATALVSACPELYRMSKDAADPPAFKCSLHPDVKPASVPKAPREFRVSHDTELSTVCSLGESTPWSAADALRGACRTLKRQGKSDWECMDASMTNKVGEVVLGPGSAHSASSASRACSRTHAAACGRRGCTAVASALAAK